MAFRKWTSIITIRVLLVGVTAGVAVGVPKFGPFLSLIGCVCFGVMGFVAPACLAIHIHNQHDAYRKKTAKKLKLLRNGGEVFLCVLIIVIGLGVGGYGSYTSVQAIMNGDETGGH